MKFRLKQLSIAAVSFVLGVSIVSTGRTAAQNTIRDGLWEGVNIAFGSDNSSSKDTANSSSAHSSSSPKSNTSSPGQNNQSNTSQKQKATSNNTPAPVPASRGTYAALGDSVAAGLGLPPAANASAQDTQCGRSPQAYPYQVAKSLNLSLTHLACSGATAGDLFTQQHISGPNPSAQLNTAFANGTPQLITITAGANDAHWDDFIRLCYTNNCATKSSSTVANAYLVSLRLKLYYLFYDIQARSNGNPPNVVLTGYYNPLSAQCANLQQNITAEEISWLNGEVSALNQTIQNVSAQFSFAKFVPVDFSGHDICSSRPWVQGLGDPAPFHPTAKGQSVIAQSVISVAE